MSLTVEDGALIVKDPSASQVYRFDWGASNLADGVTISAQAMSVRAVTTTGDADDLEISTTGSGLGILAGSRTIGFQVSGGTVGHLYEVTSRITTSETPSQTKERSVRFLIQNL